MSNKNSFFTGEVVKAAEITRKIPLNHKTKGLIPPDKKRRMYYTAEAPQAVSFFHYRAYEDFRQHEKTGNIIDGIQYTNLSVTKLGNGFRATKIPSDKHQMGFGAGGGI